jgi:heterodisulfide reductase subunit A
VAASSDPERIGVYLCHCGTNIADAVDMPRLADFARRQPGVALVRECRFLCAESGQRLIQRDIEAVSLGRVVVAACSPLMHETTFRMACQAAGLNPFNLQIANIREQVSWVVPERASATEKSMAVLAAAVRRVSLHVPLEVKQVPVVRSVLVVGAGIAGIEAALRLADAGKRVYLVEREASIGGHMAMLDRTFPTLDCSACILVPRMASVADHPQVTLLTNTEVTQVRGFVGNFEVRVRTQPRYVNQSTCTGCGECVERCPVRGISSEFNQGLGTRSAVHFPFPQAVPNLPIVDPPHCTHFTEGSCTLCQDTCPAQAIDLGQQATVQDLEVGAIILATGFQLFDPKRAIEYGYGRWDNILTSLQFERLCHPSGPTGGRILCADGRPPESVAILHCIGSRDIAYNRHCSEVCCMAALKFALTTRRQTGAKVFDFYIDMRVSGKHCEEFYEQVQRAGVVFIHGKGAEVIRREGRLLVKAEDVVLGRRVIVPVDMVVLAVAMEPRADSAQIAHLFGIGCTQQGFFMERHLKFGPVDAAAEGIFVAGACQGPKDIPESVAQGGAAAARALGLIDRGSVDIVPTVASVATSLCGGCHLCLHECPYQAIEAVDEDGRRVVRVNEVLCKSCGSCTATCPAGAITQHGFTQHQLFAEIEGLLHDRNLC